MSPAPSDRSWHEHTRVDAARLWAGGAATALVAVGVAVVGVLLVRRLIGIPLLTPGGGEAPAGEASIELSLWAGLSALAATGLLHLLMVATPHAHQFFAWIASLVVAVAVLQVFLTGFGLVEQAVTSGLYLLIGVAIISLLFGVAHTAVRYERDYDYDYPGDYSAYPGERDYRYGQPSRDYRRY